MKKWSINQKWIFERAFLIASKSWRMKHPTIAKCNPFSKAFRFVPAMAALKGTGRRQTKKLQNFRMLSDAEYFISFRYILGKILHIVNFKFCCRNKIVILLLMWYVYRLFDSQRFMSKNQNSRIIGRSLRSAFLNYSLNYYHKKNCK